MLFFTTFQPLNFCMKAQAKTSWDLLSFVKTESTDRTSWDLFIFCLKVQTKTFWDFLSFVWKYRQNHAETFYLLSKSTDKTCRNLFFLSKSTDKDMLRPFIFCLKVQTKTYWDLLSFVWKYRLRHAETFHLLSESTDKDMLRPSIFCLKVQTKTCRHL